MIKVKNITSFESNVLKLNSYSGMLYISEQ